MNPAFRTVIAASADDRLDLFRRSAMRVGTTIQNVEKDFWVCWTLDTLYHGLPAGGPRLLFKGGTSLSKAYGLIQRFSEDIDITVFRDDIGQAATATKLEAMTGKQRRRRLESIRAACSAFVTGQLRDAIALRLGEAVGKGQHAGGVDVDDADADAQTLLVRYPSVTATEADYVRPVVRIECGAKSALDPHRPVTVTPFVASDLPELDLAAPGITTIEPARTLWDKVVIVHGLRRWFDIRGELRQEGLRISRHYYDMHLLLNSEVGPQALEDRELGADCVLHARMFFDRPDYDLASAAAGRFAIVPPDGMRGTLARDYESMAAMIFGQVPSFDDVMRSMVLIEEALNRRDEW